jgi:acyl dehydratase
MRFFEDFPVGEVVEFGDWLVTEHEIVAFAKQ